MIPTIFEIGPIPVHSFGLMIALMFFAAVARLGDSFAEAGIDRRLAETFVFYGVFSGLIGARLWYLIEEWSSVKGDLVGAVFSGAGFTFYGGFVAALATVLLICKKNQISSHKFFDSGVPTLALGYAIGRLGCQLSGDGDYGISTTSWLGMSYEHGVVPTPPGIMVLPTPLYESVIAILIALFLLSDTAKQKFKAPWQMWGCALLLLSTERFIIEFIRVKQKYIGLSEAHYFSIIFALLGIYLMLRKSGASTRGR
jgi:phosphatidylglycerol:prolipoprotein diacylglycerol transferase